MKILYVGNLPFNSSSDQIRKAFEMYGKVYSIKLIHDRMTGHPRGFGFVEMEEAGAAKAMEELNNRDFGGRSLWVNEARDRVPRRRKQLPGIKPATIG